MMSPVARTRRPRLERLDEARMRALARLAGDGIELDGADQPDIADVDDVRKAFQRMDGVLPIRRKLRGARQQSLLLIDLERGDGGGAGDRVARIGIAVEEIDGLLGPGHERVVDLRVHNTAPIGMVPLVMPLAVVMISGETPK